MLMWTATDASGPDEADIAAWADFEAQARDADVLIEGARGALEPPTEAKLVTPEIATGASRKVEDGTFAQTDEQIQAFYLLDVQDSEAALVWAGKLPTYGRVEVRSLLQFDPG
jgi:hypothetical protein